jgi:hypothetical protein
VDAHDERAVDGHADAMRPVVTGVRTTFLTSRAAAVT